jgi:Domain of unknown function (DUF1906)
MSVIIDYSTIRPSTQELKAAGVTAVGRYIGWDSVPGFPSMGKNISKTEADSLLAAGIDIFLAFEYEAAAAQRGFAQGSKDAGLAGQQLAAMGAPEGICSFFALDWDVPDYAPALVDTPANAAAKLGPVAEYFKAINAAHHKYAIGAYGGYWGLKRLFDAGLIHYGWQTVAWSGGHVEPRAALLQTTSKAAISGADVNIHENKSDWGTWLQAKAALSAPPVKPPPTLAQAREAVATLNAYLASQKG